METDTVFLITWPCFWAHIILNHWDLDGKGELTFFSFFWLNPAKSSTDLMVIILHLLLYLYIYLIDSLMSDEDVYYRQGLLRLTVLRWGHKQDIPKKVASYQASRKRVSREQQTNHSSQRRSNSSCSSRKINWEWNIRIQWCPDLCFSSMFMTHLFFFVSHY